MTELELIFKMRDELYDTHLCKQDFEKYDVQTISECCEPFLWEVREYGTHLIGIGPTTILEWLATESLRMQIFRNLYAPISIISCQQPSNDRKLFYFDGLSFMQIGYDKVHELYDNLWANTIRKEFDKHPEEAEIASAPLKLVFSEGALQRKLECEKKQCELGNTSFTNCLKQISMTAIKVVEQFILEASNVFYWNSIKVTVSQSIKNQYLLFNRDRIMKWLL